MSCRGCLRVGSLLFLGEFGFSLIESGKQCLYIVDEFVWDGYIYDIFDERGFKK